MLVVVGFSVRGRISSNLSRDEYYNDSFSMVFSIGKPDQLANKFRDAVRKATAYMGFDGNKDEYAHAYPALTVQNMDYEAEAYDIDALKPNYIWYCPSVTTYYYTGQPQGYFGFCLDHMIVEGIETQSLYVVPTLTELEPYAGIKEVVATEPWFCEDWKG